MVVSIHAPTRGATVIPCKKSSISWFQSTHPHGVRLGPEIIKLGPVHVSIHAPTRGATTCRQACRGSLLRVSIHAPTRGATNTGRYISRVATGFNPRTHTGCDAGVRGEHTHTVLRRHGFQSTHPHGVRLIMSFSIKKNGMFQSTHPHGVRRSVYFRDDGQGHVSIHAPTRGATVYHDGHVFYISGFNPRTHTGCDDTQP